MWYISVSRVLWRAPNGMQWRLGSTGLGKFTRRRRMRTRKTKDLIFRLAVLQRNMMMLSLPRPQALKGDAPRRGRLLLRCPQQTASTRQTPSTSFLRSYQWHFSSPTALSCRNTSSKECTEAPRQHQPRHVSAEMSRPRARRQHLEGNDNPHLC
jgi:hypothetical protein